MPPDDLTPTMPSVEEIVWESPAIVRPVMPDDDAGLRDYAANLEADVRAYRELLSVALERLHTLTHTVEGLLRALHAIQRDHDARPR